MTDDDIVREFIKDNQYLIDDLNNENINKILDNLRNLKVNPYYRKTNCRSIFMKLLYESNPDFLKYLTTIPDYCFFFCDWLTNIIIPDNITSIGEFVFYNCKGLTSIVIPDSVTDIKDLAFYDCLGLTNITIPNSVINIGENTFSGCNPNLIVKTDSDYIEKYCKKYKIKCKKV